MAGRKEKAVPSSQPVAGRQRLPAPAAAQPLKINWRYFISIPLVHLLAMLAFVPWFFSWTGVALCLLGHFFVGSLGISVGYHRLLTHRGFTCPKWFEHTLATLGVMCLQDTPARWVAIHRMHHQHPEEQEDPHSPLVNFLWSHVGWLLFVNREHNRVHQYERYARDILRDPYYLRLERWYYWLIIYIYSAIAYYVVGFLVGWAITGDLLSGVQFGSSIMVWGVFVRTVFVWHSTWSVNSIGHLFGYRNYPTRDNSRNNWLVAIFSTGEGWHNNHHADPVSARHGHRWWEFDLAWITIRLWDKIGLVRDVKCPARSCAPGTSTTTQA
jgi:stearoyl-CoA desaturase (delta-9 desaturase)